MKISLLAIGKKHDPIFVAGIDKYCKRLSHFVNNEWLFLAPANNHLEPVKIKHQESAALALATPKDNFVILLDERGRIFDSPKLATIIKQQELSSKNITFIIGGAFGVNDILRERADLVWSLSALVFPHQMIRLILVEQLYRAYTINSGQKYHHL